MLFLAISLILGCLLLSVEAFIRPPGLFFKVIPCRENHLPTSGYNSMRRQSFIKVHADEDIPKSSETPMEFTKVLIDVERPDQSNVLESVGPPSESINSEVKNDASSLESTSVEEMDLVAQSTLSQNLIQPPADQDVLDQAAQKVRSDLDVKLTDEVSDMSTISEVYMAESAVSVASALEVPVLTTAASEEEIEAATSAVAAAAELQTMLTEVVISEAEKDSALSEPPVPVDANGLQNVGEAEMQAKEPGLQAPSLQQELSEVVATVMEEVLEESTVLELASADATVQEAAVQMAEVVQETSVQEVAVVEETTSVVEEKSLLVIQETCVQEATVVEETTAQDVAVVQETVVQEVAVVEETTSGVEEKTLQEATVIQETSVKEATVLEETTVQEAIVLHETVVQEVVVVDETTVVVVETAVQETAVQEVAVVEETTAVVQVTNAEDIPVVEETTLEETAVHNTVVQEATVEEPTGQAVAAVAPEVAVRAAAATEGENAPVEVNLEATPPQEAVAAAAAAAKLAVVAESVTESTAVAITSTEEKAADEIEVNLALLPTVGNTDVTQDSLLAPPAARTLSLTAISDSLKQKSTVELAEFAGVAVKKTATGLISATSGVIDGSIAFLSSPEAQESRTALTLSADAATSALKSVSRGVDAAKEEWDSVMKTSAEAGTLDEFLEKFFQAVQKVLTSAEVKKSVSEAGDNLAKSTEGAGRAGSLAVTGLSKRSTESSQLWKDAWLDVAEGLIMLYVTLSVAGASVVQGLQSQTKQLPDGRT